MQSVGKQVTAERRLFCIWAVCRPDARVGWPNSLKVACEHLFDALHALAFSATQVESLNVNLGARSYPIRFGADLSAEVRGEVVRLGAAGRKVAASTDENFARVQVDALHTMFGEVPALAIEPGAFDVRCRTRLAA